MTRRTASVFPSTEWDQDGTCYTWPCQLHMAVPAAHVRTPAECLEQGPGLRACPAAGLPSPGAPRCGRPVQAGQTCTVHALPRGHGPSLLHHMMQGRCSHSPLPMEGVSPFRNCGKGLPEAGRSKEAPALPPSRSIFPACRRSLSRSCDSRLNCSLCVRHFSSSSRTLLCTAEARTHGQGCAVGGTCMHACAHSVHACSRVCGGELPPISRENSI